MPKAKLKLEKTLVKKAKVASHFSDCKLGANQVIGSNVHLEMNYKNAQSLVEFGRLLESVTGDEQIETPAHVEAKGGAKK